MIRGGRSYVTSPPVFSNDAKKLLVCTSNVVSVFSVATGLQIASLEGHTSLVTTVIVVPATSPAGKILCYCWTASLDGTIRYWDFSAPEMLKTIDVRLPVYSMVIPLLLSEPNQSQTGHETRDLIAYVSVEDTSSVKGGTKVLRGHIRKCNLTKARLARGDTLRETEDPKSIVTSPSGQFFGIRHKCKIHLWNVPSGEFKGAVEKKMTLHHTKVINVFTFHPTERIIAAGDVTGRILIWRGFGNKKLASGDKTAKSRSADDMEDGPGVRGGDDTDSCTTWHWHSAGVNVLNFSSDGAYLYSGGKEGVLVVWQLDTGKKKFLPRIGSPLLYFTFSSDPTLSSVTCADNQLHLLTMPSMEILNSISGIKPPPSLPKMYEGLARTVDFDRSSGLVAICTENYCVQLYSLFNDRGISEVQVCERNHQPGDEVTVVVTAVALSPDGSLMSTAEVKLPEDGIGGLVCLKFWVSEPPNKSFNLSTIVYEPHRDSGVSAIAFHPNRRMAVSTSSCGDFKIWVCNSDKNQTLSWTCHAVGSYKRRPMMAAAFSGDGSVLAVAAENVITLWNPDKNILLAVLGETLAPIVRLSFVGKSEFLVAASHGSTPQLSVWNMSKLSLSWSYRIHMEALATAVDSSSFAVLALLPESLVSVKSNEDAFNGRDGAVLFFNGSDPTPAAMWSVTQARGGSLSFIEGNQTYTMNDQTSPSDEKPSRLLLAYVNGDHEYVLFDPHSDESHERSVIDYESVAAHEETGEYGYATLYGQLPDYDKRRQEEKEKTWSITVSAERPWEKIFSGSTLNFPPLPKLCASFLEALLHMNENA
ncbi:PREDICTED: WD repeat-containing protein 75 [Tarenaya hassleriana]|uniref:WD repeat-containing protein 75 n=1 Tax=Tarenaya hassleriana TaxID=28532 RepID=UPI00053C2EDE|nr:PREDICTED: WD repeat-containing protein 75 [Tarenaya hassleriana]